MEAARAAERAQALARAREERAAAREVRREALPPRRVVRRTITGLAAELDQALCQYVGARWPEETGDFRALYAWARQQEEWLAQREALAGSDEEG